MKKNKVITIKIKPPQKETIYVWGFVLIGLYFLAFLVINSYAQSNGLTKRSFTNPTDWFKPNPTLTPTPTPIPTSTPTPTAKPTVKPKQFNNQINCTVDDKCGGGTRKLTKDQCLKTVCCEVVKGGEWIFYNTIEECRRDQQAKLPQQSQQNTNNQPDYLNWPEVRTNGGNLVLRCSGNIEAVKKADSNMSTAYTAYTQPDLKCINENRETEQCKQLKADWDNKYNTLTATIKTEGCLMKK